MRIHFTRSILDRCFCAFLSLPLMAFTGWILFEIYHEEKTPEDLDWVIRLLGDVGLDLVVAAFLLSVLGMIWALFAPGWLSRAARFCLNHFLLGIVALVLALVGMLVISYLN